MEQLPRTLKDFWLYYWRFSPGTWVLYFLQDIVHFSRYQLSFVLVGLGVDSLIGRDPSEGIPPQVWGYVFGVFFLLSFGEAMHVWTVYIMRHWKPRLRAKVRSDFFSYALGHSHAYFQNNFAGALARKITEVAESSVRLHDHLRFNIVGAMISMATATVISFFISPLYTMVLVAFIISVTLPVILRIKRISGRSYDFSIARANVTGTVVDILSNALSMRSFANIPHEMEMHAYDTDIERRRDYKRIMTLAQIENYRRLSLVLLGGGMFTALVLGWQAGFVSVGQISAMMGQTMMLVGATWMFGWGVIMTADELGYISDAIRIVTTEHGVQDKEGAKELVVTERRVEFRDVTFTYPGQTVFDHLNITLEPRQKVGLMGPSGAGKSSFISVLLRLFDVQEGQVLIDGQDISQVTQDSLRAHIAVIPQDTSLFHRSLADNIRYGKLGATDEEVIEAAKKAHAHEFIESLPDGYNTMVGERGVKLSGGQRQRIAIARAILKDAPILVLDEATSALDSESEHLIQQSLKELMEGKTVIAIAHRLSTISHLDRLIAMENGRIVEDGTHRELIEKGGHYARLWTMQSGGFIGAEQQEDAA